MSRLHHMKFCGDLLIKCAKKKNLLLLNGMATMHEVKMLQNFKKMVQKIIILHCVSNYPAKLNSLNLSAISAFKKKQDSK